MSWVTFTLGEICNLITDGKHGDCRNQDSSGYYFLSAKDVRDGNLFYHNSRQITHDDFLETHRRTNLKPGDILLTNSGTIGRLAIAKDIPETSRTTFQKSVAVLKPNNEVVTSKFLYYSLLANTSGLEHSAAGAAQKNLLLGSLRKFNVKLPDLPTQERIASILSAYDDLIENNRRRITLLEQAARLLYREWFVHFRFPGHETAKFVDGLPEGWTQTTVFDGVDILSGGTPKTSNAEYWGGQIPFFTPKDTGDFVYVNGTEKMITETGLKNCNSRLYEKDTLFITARGTVGKLRLAQRPMAMNQSCYALRSKCKLTQAHLYFAISDRVNHLKGQAGGSVFAAIVVDTFKKIPLLLPSDEIATDFATFASRTLSQIDCLAKQIAQLIRARDLLLPRLMDGRIPV